MITPKVIFQVAIIYWSLSKEGKGFFKSSLSKYRQFAKISKDPARLDSGKIIYFVKNFKVADKVFSSQVSASLCAELGRDKAAVYSRFVSYGWFSLLIWGKLLEAFGLNYDEKAKERCILVAFTHREWNDLFDLKGYTFDQLIKAFDGRMDIPKELVFLRQLKQMDKKLAPPERFGAYYQHMQGFDICRLFEYSPAKAAIILDQVAPFVAMLFIYIMIPEVPEKLKETVKPIARWLYMLDELADLEHDKKIGRITYMIMAKDPEVEMRRQLEVCCGSIKRNALYPDELIRLMEAVTLKIIQAGKSGVDIESSIFSL